MASPTEATFALDVGDVPAPDHSAHPQGFVVEVEPGERVHFLDWGAPDLPPGAPRPAGALLVHGLSQTAWTWTPVARRMAGRMHVVAMDLRGHGLSDSPATGYAPATLAEDVVAVAEGSGLLAEAGDGIILAGHGFGAIVAAWAAARLGGRVRGLLLVDGGWQDLARVSGVDPDEFLRSLDEPPEVLRSMGAYLADRRDFDPATWDADQEQAARATVVEQVSGRLTPAMRPHALARSVEAMFAYDPLAVLPSIGVPIIAFAAADDDDGSATAGLRDVQERLAAVGRPPIRVARFPDAGHNLMRYRPEAVCAAILDLTSTIEP